MKEMMVYLVGAGPGAKDLITLRGLECIRCADCVVYDRLIDPALLDEAPAGCELIYVGKAAGKHSATQEEINDILVERAKNGRNIVRLKGGDPYVFGRGGEEALRLRAEGIPFQVIPGVTSAIAGPALAGIPVTHREVSRSVHIITAHTKEGGIADNELSALATVEGTLVFLMGLSEAGAIAGGLIRHGKSPICPAAAVSCAGTPNQRTVISTLEKLAEDIEKSGIVSPAIIIVGEVVDLRNELDFLGDMPLFGRRIMVTSDSGRNGSIAEKIQMLGGEAVSAPMVELTPRIGALSEYIGKISEYTYVIFTSGHTVDIFMSELFNAGRDIRALAGIKACAVGPSTRTKLEQYGVIADIVPDKYSSEGLIEHLADKLHADDKILLPQSAAAQRKLRETLDGICRVDAVDIYDANLPQGGADAAAKALEGRLDGVIFTSSLAAENLGKCADIEKLRSGEIKSFSLGPSTSRALEKLGISPIESDVSTVASLMEKLKEYFREVDII